MAAATTLSQTFSETAQRDELILKHLHLVQVIAGSVQRSLGVHVELDDLIHAGNMGLLDAATKYREDKEVSFPAYAKHRIRGAILDSLRQIDWASRDTRRQFRHMQTVTRELSTRLQRTPTQEEVAEAMGLDQRRWNAFMIDVRTLGLAASRETAPASQDGPVREIPSTGADCPQQQFERSQLRQRLSSAMSCLPERHQQVVQMYYDREMTMKEIGATLGVNESRVSQIHKAALTKMQGFLGGAGISCSAALA